MNKINKLLVILILVLLSPKSIIAHEQLEDGWHIVKAATINTNCNYKTNWAYYQSGKETKRFCQMILAHRGWGDAPENSLAALEQVKDNGYYGYEIDVRFTKDSIPVLMHDSTINRVARDNNLKELSDTIYVNDLTFNELNQYNFPITRAGTLLKSFKNNKITKFEDALKYSKNNGLLMYIELKKGTKKQITSIAEMVKKYNMGDKVVWTGKKVTLYSYVKNVIENCIIHIQITKDITETTNCGSDAYCGNKSEKKQIYNSLKTKNNVVVFSDDDNFDTKGYAYMNFVNLPDKQSSYPKNKYKLSTVPQATINISKTNMSLNYGKSSTITYTYNGDGEVKCQSGDNKVVTCNVDKKNQKITINAVGSSNKNINVLVYGAQGTKYSATKDTKLVVTVITPVTSVSLSNTNLSLYMGESISIHPIITPTLATNQEVIWSSSNPTVAIVSNGKVTAKSVGTSTITVKTVDGNKIATCTITVSNPPAQIISVESISLNNNNLTLYVGNSKELITTILPSNATNKSINWSSSNPTVATVSNGTVIAKALGKTTITAVTIDGNKEASCVVNVIKSKDNSSNQENNSNNNQPNNDEYNNILQDLMHKIERPNTILIIVIIVLAIACSIILSKIIKYFKVDKP